MTTDPRGSREQRGYGAEHQRLRAALVEAATPETLCVRCGGLLGDPRLAHLGHSDDRSTWVGLEHAGCNVAAANTMRASRARRQEEPHPGLREGQNDRLCARMMGTANPQVQVDTGSGERPHPCRRSR